MEKRIKYYDSIRFIACFWVFFTHFIAAYCPQLLRYWKIAPTCYLLKGVSGKLAVALFAVVLGYFAARSGKNQKSIAGYTIKRYLYFMFAGFLINSLYYIAGILGWLEAKVDFLGYIKNTLLLGSKMFAAYWCIQLFFVGSVLCFLNSKYKLNIYIALLEIILLIFLKQEWIAICILGYIFYILEEKEWFQKALEKVWLQILLLLLSFLLVKLPQSPYKNILNGFSGFLLLCVLAKCTVLQKVVDTVSYKGLGKITQNYMAFYLIHSFTYNTLGRFVFGLCGQMDFWLKISLTFMVSFVAIALLSVPVNILLNYITKKSNQLVDYILLR